jgi:hypothetical protein
MTATLFPATALEQLLGTVGEAMTTEVVALQTGRLGHSVPLSDQEHDQVGVADGGKACLLRRSGRGWKVLRTHDLMTERLDGCLGSCAVLPVTTDERTDEDLHDDLFKSGAGDMGPRAPTTSGLLDSSLDRSRAWMYVVQYLTGIARWGKATNP